jgi:hypothetical protein
MRQVTGSMMNVVKGMDQAMKAMDLEKVCLLPLHSRAKICKEVRGRGGADKR